MTGNYIIRIDTNAPPTLNTTYNGDWNRYPIKTNVYVGNGIASHDEALIDAYSVATNWTELYNRGMLLPWYLHEHTPALQSYNSSAPNYYPALCICFEQAGYGRYITTNNKTKGWYMSDEEAASITNTGDVLKNKSTVTDVNGICGTVGATYTLTSADLSSFTNIESIDLSGSTKMSNVIIAQNSPLSKYKLPTVDCGWRNSGGYIESTGTQYIDTGIVPNINTELECEFIKLNSIDSWFYGCRDSAGVNEFIGLFVAGQNTSSFRFGNREFDITQISNNVRHTVKHNKTNVLIDDVIVGTFTSPTFGTTSKTIMLLGSNTSAKIYSLKIRDNGTLVREMYPAVDSNGVVCMYDYVTK